jgi:16S rRNA processing protein RimM
MRSSSRTTDKPSYEPPEHVLVGVVLRPHGLKGEVVVAVETDRPERFAPGSELQLVEGSGHRRSVTVAGARQTGRGLLVAFEGVSDRDAAERLRRARLEIERARVPAADEGQYYLFELVGCSCFDEREGELGVVVDFVEGGADLLFEVARPEGGKLLLPFVDRFVVDVDTVARRIDWRLPKGLIETCVSRS